MRSLICWKVFENYTNWRTQIWTFNEYSFDIFGKKWSSYRRLQRTKLQKSSNYFGKYSGLQTRIKRNLNSLPLSLTHHMPLAWWVSSCWVCTRDKFFLNCSEIIKFHAISTNQWDTLIKCISLMKVLKRSSKIRLPAQADAVPTLHRDHKQIRKVSTSIIMKRYESL